MELTTEALRDIMPFGAHMDMHLVSAPVVWLSTDAAMYVGMVYSYLPFMILPLYATLAKMDPAFLVGAPNDRGEGFERARNHQQVVPGRGKTAAVELGAAG